VNYRCGSWATRPMLIINFTPMGGCVEPLQADLNADCKVDFADLAILASQWLSGAIQPRIQGTVNIRDIDTFHFDPAVVNTSRPDIFKPGHFSIFDVLIHLHRQGRIQLDYHFSVTIPAISRGIRHTRRPTLPARMLTGVMIGAVMPCERSSARYSVTSVVRRFLLTGMRLIWYK
jgi:hypothetical protein